MSLVDEIVEVRRGNVYLKISQAEVAKYLAKGFDVVDESGNVIKACVPNDLGILRKAYVEKDNEIKALKREISALKAQIADLNAVKSTTQTKKVQSKKSER